MRLVYFKLPPADRRQKKVRKHCFLSLRGMGGLWDLLKVDDFEFPKGQSRNSCRKRRFGHPPRASRATVGNGAMEINYNAVQVIYRKNT